MLGSREAGDMSHTLSGTHATARSVLLWRMSAHVVHNLLLELQLVGREPAPQLRLPVCQLLRHLVQAAAEGGVLSLWARHGTAGACQWQANKMDGEEGAASARWTNTKLIVLPPAPAGHAAALGVGPRPCRPLGRRTCN